MNKYWEGFNDKYIEILKAADILAIEQEQKNELYKDVQNSIFDKPLTDSSIYRKGGKFITPYHAKLYHKRKNGEICCPVYDISYKLIIQQEKNKLYVKKLNATEKAKPRIIKRDLMDFSEAKDEFLNSYLLDSFFHQDKAFVLDSQNIKVIDNLISYFTRQRSSELSIKKGICLYGGIGTGKTTIMKQLSKFTKDKNLETQFEFIYMDEVYSDCDSLGLESLNAYKFRACAFDDIGMRADNNVNNYGTKINAYKELVRRQYVRFSRTIPSLSHYTTNIQYQNEDFAKELSKVFGARELDRFREMCNFVQLGGDSRRDKFIN